MHFVGKKVFVSTIHSTEIKYMCNFCIYMYVCVFKYSVKNVLYLCAYIILLRFCECMLVSMQPYNFLSFDTLLTMYDEAKKYRKFRANEKRQF